MMPYSYPDLQDRIALFFILVLVFSSKISAQNEGDNYLVYAQTFADKLLANGKDQVGSVRSNLWASVIQVPTGQIPDPKDEVPPTRGTRPHDRAVWGSNYYHDLGTLKVMELLSRISGKENYRQEAQVYTKDFLRLSQNEGTGLLGWGEHLYYHFYDDVVTVSDGKDVLSGRRKYDHEFLAATPNWEQLWEVDPQRTRRAIEGLRFHFRGFQTQSYLYNRHAHWNIVNPQKAPWPVEQFQRDGQPWIKHSALLAYSFFFLYTKTGESEWLKWARGVGNLYWNYRDQDTQLTPSCIDDQRPNTRLANLTSMSYLSYWLLKAWRLQPEETWLKEEAVSMLQAIESYSWQPGQRFYGGSFETDGQPVDLEPIDIYTTGYSSSGLFHFGRIAAYFARELKDPTYELMVYRCAGMANREDFPESFVINSLAEAMNFYLDAYDLSYDPVYLEKARYFADQGIKKLYRGGWFVRQPGDDYYEAKLGTGDYVLGLVRLHLRLHPELNQYAGFDWSF